MQKHLLSVVLFVTSVQLHATDFQACLDQFPDSQPPVIIKSQVGYVDLKNLCFDEFAVIHSGRTKTPLVVVETLTREQLFL
jgi:endonuclease G